MYHIYRMYSDRQAWANSVDPDKMPQKMASHQGLHCLLLIQQFLDTTSGSKLYFCLFVLQFYGPVNPSGSCQVQSFYLTTLFTSRRLASIVHILSPETDNCPFWISARERMTIANISWSISTKECCRPRWGSKPRPPGLQSDAHPTEPLRPAKAKIIYKKKKKKKISITVICITNNFKQGHKNTF